MGARYKQSTKVSPYIHENACFVGAREDERRQQIGDISWPCFGDLSASAFYGFPGDIVSSEIPNKDSSRIESGFASGQLPPESAIFGRTAIMHDIREKLEKVAVRNVPVLIEGDGGTGKEVLARWIHTRSPWGSGPLVKVNCAAIPGTLLESELFGYEKGAFTGANNRKIGRVELARYGTLFLDEIGELDHGLQAKLLHFLQDGQFSRLGDHEVQNVETRLICATNRPLEKAIGSGQFRADLFYRINVIHLHMPNLRDRCEDIELLCNYFLANSNARFELSAPPISKSLLHIFQNHPWPGNIRELENRIARYVIFGAEDNSDERLPRHPANRVPKEVSAVGSIPLKRIAKQAVRDLERNVILGVLQANHWNRRKAAEILKISYRALIYKIREVGLSTERHTTNGGSQGKPSGKNAATIRRLPHPDTAPSSS
jgi:two-component system, NtrC family, response regulator AtoC